jgi:hypothetical protein
MEDEVRYFGSDSLKEAWEMQMNAIVARDKP